MNINDAKLFVEIIDGASKKDLQAILKHATSVYKDLAVSGSDRQTWMLFAKLIRAQIGRF